MKNTIGFNLHPTKTLRYRIKNNKTLIFKSRMNYNTGITINDYPLINSDVVDKLTFLRNKGFTQYKFIGGNNSTAFNTPIDKGDEVNIIINENSAYDENFEYGAIIGSSVKTANEIFAPDQNGNYDISDYSAVPATTLLKRIKTFPTGSNNTIRINKDTAAKYVEGFRTENLINEGYDNGTVNGSINVTYNNGVFSFNGTATQKGDKTNNFYKKFFILPAGIYNYRIHWLSEIIQNRSDVAVQLTHEDNTTITSITNEGYKSFTLTENTNVYIGVSLLELQDYDISFQIILSKNDVKTNYIHPIEKLDYVVAQANAKGYDVTIANNESDIKLIEKVEFDGTKYVDSGIKVHSDTRPIELDLTTEAKENKNPYIFGYRSVTNASYRKFGLYVSAKDSLNKGNIIYANGQSSSILVPASVSSELGSFLKKTRKQILIQENRKVFINNIKVRIFSEQTYTSVNTAPIGQGIADDTGNINKITNINIDYYHCLIVDNLFIPANNGTTDGMVNLKDMSFHPLISIN